MDKKLILVIIIIVMVLLSGCAIDDVPKDCNELEESILGGRDQCWTNQAKEKKDVKICENIESSTQKSACVANVAIAMENLNSVFLCTQTKGIDTDYCSRYVLKNQKIADLAINNCEQHTRSVDRDLCFVNLAFLSDDPITCKYSSQPSRCWGLLAANLRVEVRERFCDDAPEPEVCKDFMDGVLKNRSPKSDTPILDAIEKLRI